MRVRGFSQYSRLTSTSPTLDYYRRSIEIHRSRPSPPHFQSSLHTPAEGEEEEWECTRDHGRTSTPVPFIRDWRTTVLLAADL
ncbi:hypothetical protein BD311DRAFT_708751 [Dichomitus squalens]|nr:hypothetical protein BD311DRAFT_708702 [Dichomitus squalens]TBU34884.1 hypothetical protein BD311DRAFT_708751 [Dichomitus squalens]